jgi:hypothetical protein
MYVCNSLTALLILCRTAQVKAQLQPVCWCRAASKDARHSSSAMPVTTSYGTSSLLILEPFFSPLQELVQLNKKYADQGLVIMAWCGSLSTQQLATWHKARLKHMCGCLGCWRCCLAAAAVAAAEGAATGSSAVQAVCWHAELWMHDVRF